MSEYLDIAGYAELLGVPTSWVRTHVAVLHHTRVGQRHVRFTPADVEANRREWATGPKAAETPARRRSRTSRQQVAGQVVAFVPKPSTPSRRTA